MDGSDKYPSEPLEPGDQGSRPETPTDEQDQLHSFSSADTPTESPQDSGIGRSSSGTLEDDRSRSHSRSSFTTDSCSLTSPQSHGTPEKENTMNPNARSKVSIKNEEIINRMVDYMFNQSELNDRLPNIAQTCRETSRQAQFHGSMSSSTNLETGQRLTKDSTRKKGKAVKRKSDEHEDSLTYGAAASSSSPISPNMQRTPGSYNTQLTREQAASSSNNPVSPTSRTGLNQNLPNENFADSTYNTVSPKKRLVNRARAQSDGTYPIEGEPLDLSSQRGSQDLPLDLSMHRQSQNLSRNISTESIGTSTENLNFNPPHSSNIQSGLSESLSDIEQTFRGMMQNREIGQEIPESVPTMLDHHNVREDENSQTRYPRQVLDHLDAPKEQYTDGNTESDMYRSWHVDGNTAGPSYEDRNSAGPSYRDQHEDRNPAGPYRDQHADRNPAGPSYRDPHADPNPAGPSYRDQHADRNPAGPSYRDQHVDRNPAGPSYRDQHTDLNPGDSFRGRPTDRNTTRDSFDKRKRYSSLDENQISNIQRPHESLSHRRSGGHSRDDNTHISTLDRNRSLIETLNRTVEHLSRVQSPRVPLEQRLRLGPGFQTGLSRMNQSNEINLPPTNRRQNIPNQTGACYVPPEPYLDPALSEEVFRNPEDTDEEND